MNALDESGSRPLPLRFVASRGPSGSARCPGIGVANARSRREIRHRASFVASRLAAVRIPLQESTRVWASIQGLICACRAFRCLYLLGTTSPKNPKGTCRVRLYVGSGGAASYLAQVLNTSENKGWTESNVRISHAAMSLAHYGACSSAAGSGAFHRLCSRYLRLHERGLHRGGLRRR